MVLEVFRVHARIAVLARLILRALVPCFQKGGHREPTP